MSSTSQPVVNSGRLHSNSGVSLVSGVFPSMALTPNVRDSLLAALGAGMGASAANAPVVCIFATAAVSYAIVSTLIKKVS